MSIRIKDVVAKRSIRSRFLLMDDRHSLSDFGIIDCLRYANKKMALVDCVRQGGVKGLMNGAIRVLCAGLAFLVSLAGPASAAPPSDCVNKFAGKWSILITATGQRYPSTIRPDGTVKSECLGSFQDQHWTCSGSSFTLLDPVTLTSTLSPDGRKMTGPGVISTRIGEPSASAKPAAKTPTKQASDTCLTPQPEPAFLAIRPTT